MRDGSLRSLQRRKSLSEQVADVVSEEIASGRFKVGQMLSELKIARELDVSRTPVREAFTRLEHKGLLVTVPQSGTYVFETSPKEFLDLANIRGCLEVEGLRQGYDGPKGAFMDELSQVSDALEFAIAREDRAEFQELDQRFHSAFVRHSGNALLLDMYRPIGLKFKALVNNDLVSNYRDTVLEGDHRSIERNLTEGNIVGAINLLVARTRKFSLA
ncbi:MAG: GntR family transcriptional regulator [Shimia sp.]